MSNHLAGETSPYLLQHADNPVDWHPWSEAALERARRDNKPILLSIGYSACHWCHVMAHESFENDDIAALMNARFVNIKVDREERPDLDRIYQVAHQLLSRRPGGWPLTVVLDPLTLAPFFAGTYFPREPRHGMPGFDAVLTRVSDWFDEHRDELTGQDENLRNVFAQLEPVPEAGTRLDAAPLSEARSRFMQSFDAEYGGFSGAPKFPHPASVEFLLRGQARGETDPRARQMALFTLRRMAQGGLFDQVGGGFCRYSVDERWQIPHFEKMLYDNGPLLTLYCHALQIEPDPLFRRTAEATADWVMREMQLSEGGYCASLDADSEGAEGRFYVWDTEQARALLGEDYELAARHFGLDRAPNFEGRWHLTVHAGEPALAEQLDIPETEVRKRLDRARRVLFEARAERVHPGRDDKVLTAWNALMIGGMAVAARVLARDDCLQSARRAADFLHRRLWRDGRLLAAYRDGRAHLPAYLDDHAFLLDALLTLLQVDWRSADLAFAQALTDLLLARFEDRENGGFFFTADDHERLLYRPKPLADESLPSGNGVAARALLQLGHLLGETRYLHAAERCLRMSWTLLREQPMAHTSLLEALAVSLAEPEIVILRGDVSIIDQWRRIASAGYAPERLVFAIPADAQDLPPALAARRPPRNGEDAVAYICRGTRCSAPIESLDELQAQLGG